MDANAQPADDAAVRAVADLIASAQAAGASDVHLHLNGAAARVDFRLDGLMTPVEPLPMEVAERAFGRIKYLARLKTYQDSLPQDGRIGRDEVGADHDIRVATYPTVTGEKIVLRFFPETVETLDDLHYPPGPREVLGRFLQSQSGLLLLTGPAGSGKTTTIYACLRHLAEGGGRHIITVEDPVEQILPGIMQTEVNEARGLTFAKAARHLVRQDPQVLAIGEIRDEETARIAVRAALTGHLVISTLHAGSCAGVVERLLVMCPDRYAVVSSLALILNQRLVRKLCTECVGQGCADCLQTGYRHRLPVCEWTELNDAKRAALRAEGAAAVAGEVGLTEAGRALVEENLTNAAELERVLGA